LASCQAPYIILWDAAFQQWILSVKQENRLANIPVGHWRAEFYTYAYICGSTAAGEALPPHFQLKTDATEASQMKISVQFIASVHNVMGKFGHKEKKLHPCTFGLNEKAGMNKVESDKCF